jgi:hypothetical protein
VKTKLAKAVLARGKTGKGLVKCKQMSKMPGTSNLCSCWQALLAGRPQGSTSAITKLPMIEFGKIQEAYGEHKTASLQAYTELANFCGRVSLSWRKKQHGPFLETLTKVADEIQAIRTQAIVENLNEAQVIPQMDKILASCSSTGGTAPVIACC